MKLRNSNQPRGAMTLTEVLVVVAICAVLIAMLLPSLATARRKAAKIHCVNFLMQIGTACRVWEGDNFGKYPTQASTTNGGAMEQAVVGNVAAVFQVMSNELSTPYILVCPSDANRQRATDFTTNFGPANISYFISLDAADRYPTSILVGDDNFEIKGVPVQSGVLSLTTNTPIAWTGERHQFTGNIAMADGSVSSTTDSGLTNEIIEQYAGSPDFTNRFRIVIP